MPNRTRVSRSFWRGGKRVVTFFSRRDLKKIDDVAEQKESKEKKELVRRLLDRISRQFEVGSRKEFCCRKCVEGMPNYVRQKNGYEREVDECYDWHKFKKKVMKEMG